VRKDPNAALAVLSHKLNHGFFLLRGVLIYATVTYSGNAVHWRKEEDFVGRALTPRDVAPPGLPLRARVAFASRWGTVVHARLLQFR